MNLFSNNVRTLALVLALLFTFTLAPSPTLAQSPSNNWHFYGGVVGLYNAPDRVIYNVYDPSNGYTARLECFYNEMQECDRVGMGHWVIMEGYTKGVAAGCYDGANNEMHVTRIQLWNWLNNTWYEIGVGE